MLHKIIFPMSDTDPNARLHCYLHDSPERPAPAVVLCPGGAYLAVGMETEGESAALHFFCRGLQVFVLEYSVGLHSAWPATVVEASRAIALIRKNSKEWKVCPDKIAIGGFSAGGGVSLCLGTYWDDPQIQAAAGVSGRQNRPDALLQFYTTYRSLPLFAPEGLQEFSPDCLGRISEKTPPAFWAHTYEDGNGSMEYVLAAASALSRCGVPTEVHVYTCGAHGQLSRPSQTGADGIRSAGLYDWLDRCIEWLEDLFLRGMENRKADRARYVPGESMTSMVLHSGKEGSPFDEDGVLKKSAPLRTISSDPEAMALLSEYVPYLRQFASPECQEVIGPDKMGAARCVLTQTALGTSIGTWLEYAGLDQGDPFIEEGPGEAVRQCLYQLTQIRNRGE